MAIDTTPPSPAHGATLSTSVITRVVMHGHGALVTRRVTPEAYTLHDDGSVTIAVPDITARARRQGVRVKLDAASPQRLLSVRSERTLVGGAAKQGEALEAMQALERELRDVRQLKEIVRARHQAITGLVLMPARHRTWQERGPLQRIDTTFKISALIHARQQRHDEELLTLTERITELGDQIAQQSIALAQQSSASHYTDQPSTTIFVTLSGTGLLAPFELSYIVDEARWWPLYTLRLTQGGTHADLSMEAMVTQDSGEDWEDVHIALSTADLATDANLPELAALKLGKRRPAPRSGYRDAPDGLERLFISHDLFMSRQQPASRAEPAAGYARDAHIYEDEAYDDEVVDEPLVELAREGGASRGGVNVFDEIAASAAPMTPASMPAPMYEKAMPARSSGFFGSVGGSVTKKVAPHEFARESMAAPTRKQRALIDDLAIEERSVSGGEAFEEEQMTPAQSWLDFAQLVISDAAHRGARGTLQRAPDTGHSSRGSIARAESSAADAKLFNPRISRGHYDHRYEGTAHIVTVPSDGVLHRIDVLRRHTEASLSWRCVALEEESVFRIASISNPFKAPMLTGPIDVFVEGSFLLSTRQHNVEVGAKLEVGLGVDERIRVARNVRTEEEQLGLLGGKTSITHIITTELASHLGFEATVHVIDRVPITEDDDVHIKELAHDPPARTYTQREQHQEIQGGRSWQIALPPGQKRTITSTYTITLSSKEELVGGNRRD